MPLKKPKRRSREGLPDLRVELDWRAYFRAFCEAHGEPHEVGGRLWFEDGWSYSNTAYAGPEYPPPADPERLRRCQLDYWRQRRSEVNDERRLLASRLRGIEDLQSAKSMPLLRKVKVSEDGTMPDGTPFRRARFEAAPIDAEALMVRLEGLTREQVHCETKIKELSDDEVRRGVE